MARNGLIGRAVRRLGLLAGFAGVSLVSACGAGGEAGMATPAGPEPGQPIQAIQVAATARLPAEAACPPAGRDFGRWLSEFRDRAVAAGVAPAVAARALAGLTPDPEVVRRDRHQPEFTRAMWDYISTAVSASRVARGRALLTRHRQVLDAITARFGVPGSVIVAIFGLETDYGGFTGGFSLVRSLATLGFSGRRRGFGCVQLFHALRLIERNDLAPSALTGSWAGATGLTQFIPSSLARYGVDFDQDGRIDIWRSHADAFASTANHLVRAGWRAGAPWGLEVVLPSGFDWRMAAPDQTRPVADWAWLGVRPAADGARLPPPDLAARVEVPAGHRGPAFLVTDNFQAILGYNNATSYALAVGLLSDRFGGAGSPRLGASAHAGGVVRPWPTDERPLKRAERLLLQRRLDALGYAVGAIDGIIGRRTRAAVRTFQDDVGLPADGFASSSLLTRLGSATSGTP